METLLTRWEELCVCITKESKPPWSGFSGQVGHEIFRFLGLEALWSWLFSAHLAYPEDGTIISYFRDLKNQSGTRQDKVKRQDQLHVLNYLVSPGIEDWIHVGKVSHGSRS